MLNIAQVVLYRKMDLGEKNIVEMIAKVIEEGKTVAILQRSNIVVLVKLVFYLDFNYVKYDLNLRGGFIVKNIYIYKNKT